jgi:transposase InsO family protein
LALTPTQQRQLVAELGPHYPVTTVCQVLGCARSSYYYQPQAKADAGVLAVLKEIAGEFPRYGYRRLTAEAQRRGYPVNSKRVRRLMAQAGLTPQQKPQRRLTTNSRHGYPRYPNLVQTLTVQRPEQVWVADITYIRLQREFVYLAVLMDVYTRQVRGWHLGRSLEQELTLTALHRALAYATPSIHHSDQGVQYAATAYVELLHAHGVRISMAEVGEPAQNGYAERLMRTIKEEEVSLTEYEDYADAYHQIGTFLEAVYNRKRIHSALGYLTPAEFEQQWRTQQAAHKNVV